MKRTISLFGLILAAVLGMGASESSCGGPPSSDQVQRQQQETILKEATAQTGMPAIKNFRERKLMKDILELRDQTGLVTYTYLFSEMRGCLVPFGNTVGYPLPYATQYTNPEKDIWGSNGASLTVPQADPNGLFSPSSAEATWTLMKDPHGVETGVVYSEPRLVVMPFKADEGAICSKQ